MHKKINASLALAALAAALFLYHRSTQCFPKEDIARLSAAACEKVNPLYPDDCMERFSRLYGEYHACDAQGVHIDVAALFPGQCTAF